MSEVTEDLPNPPSFLNEDLTDLIHPANPRAVVVTSRQWMEPYHFLEQHELGARLRTSNVHAHGLALWLRLLRLYLDAFSRAYDWSSEPNRERGQAIAFRLDLLGLAGTNFKLALDALMAGYYSGCMAIERHMLETSRRVAYARLCSEDIWRWYPRDMWPDDVVAAPEGGMPTRYPDARHIAEIIGERGNQRDRDFLGKAERGFAILTDHSHPTIEGTTQTWHPDDPAHRVFGPTFSDPHCRRCLTWGLVSGTKLLEEIHLIDAQGREWTEELSRVMDRLADWLEAYQN